VLISNLMVGYHAWVNQDEVVLFVLGDTMALHRFNLITKQDEVVAKSIGRSLHAIPKSKAMSFVHKVSENEWVIKKLNANNTTEKIVNALPGCEDLTWLPDGKILMSNGKKLFYFDTKNPDAWKEVTMPPMSGVISRVAVNKHGDKLAVVVSE
jgi:hypothetical protein